MNCQLFMSLVVDLTRDGFAEESAHSEALTHAGSCPECAAHLAEQRALSLALRRPDDGEAPAHIEEAVLAGYRARFGQAAANPKPQRLAPAWYWGIAAAIVLMIMGTWLFRLVQIEPPAKAGLSQSRPDVPKPGTAIAATESTSSGAVSAPVAPVNTSAMAKLPPKPGPRQAQAETQEIATDFIPLVSRAEISAMESGQLVRVLMPRSAMASYGLPFNQERADMPVSAQVLIGNDGVARAIRFLGDSKGNTIQTGLQLKR
jgi:hypothetical protein